LRSARKQYSKEAIQFCALELRGRLLVEALLAMCSFFLQFALRELDPRLPLRELTMEPSMCYAHPGLLDTASRRRKRFTRNMCTAHPAPNHKRGTSSDEKARTRNQARGQGTRNGRAPGNQGNTQGPGPGTDGNPRDQWAYMQTV